jgi:hypothetical protein
METNIKVLIDPLKNEVHLPVEFENVLVSKGALDKDLSVVILKPAVIIKPGDSQPYLYHARLVGWEITLLLRSEWQNHFWLVSECLWDADSNLLKQLIVNNHWVTFSQK